VSTCYREEFGQSEPISGRSNRQASLGGDLWRGARHRDAITVPTGNQTDSGELLRRFAPRVAMVQTIEARQGGHVCGGGRLPLDCPFVWVSFSRES
jgi:hypothetical protein